MSIAFLKYMFNIGCYHEVSRYFIYFQNILLVYIHFYFDTQSKFHREGTYFYIMAMQTN